MKIATTFESTQKKGKEKNFPTYDLPGMYSFGGIDHFHIKRTTAQTE